MFWKELTTFAAKCWKINCLPVEIEAILNEESLLDALNVGFADEVAILIL